MHLSNLARGCTMVHHHQWIYPRIFRSQRKPPVPRWMWSLFRYIAYSFVWATSQPQMWSEEAIAGTTTQHLLPIDEALKNLLVFGDNAFIIFAKPIVAVLCNVIIDCISQWVWDDQQGAQGWVGKRQVWCNFQCSCSQNMKVLVPSLWRMQHITIEMNSFLGNYSRVIYYVLI